MSTSFTPLSVSNCVLWLDASDTATVSVSGSNLTGWTDKSGRNASVNSISSTPPTYNGSNAITLVASNATFIRGSLDTTYSSNASLFVVGSYTSNSASPIYLPRLFNLGSNFTSERTMIGQLNIVAQNTSPQILTYTNTGDNPTGLGVNILTSVNASYSTRFMFGNISTYNGSTTVLTNNTFINGNTSTFSSFSTTYTPSGSYVSSYNKYSIGGYVNVLINPNEDSYNGTVSEVLLYTRVLSSTERQQLEGYLAWKWNLVSFLPLSHPYKFFSPSSTVLPPIISTPTFTGTEYIRRPFSYTFSSTITDYPTSIQLTDSSPGLLSSISGDTFASTTGFQGSPGSAGTLIADAIASNSPYVKLLAGSDTGNVDGTGSNAKLEALGFMEFDSAGNMLIGDISGIRMITPSGESTRYLNTSPYGVAGIVYDSMSNLFITSGYGIYKVLPDKSYTLFAGDASGNPGFVNGTGANARFDVPLGLDIDLSTNTLYVADTGNCAIRQVTSAGVVTTLAGNGTGGGGFSIRRDGFVTGSSTAVYVARSRIGNVGFSTNTALNNNRFVNPSSGMSNARPQGIVYGGGRWVAVGSPSNRVSTSTNGNTWLTASSTGIESNLKIDYGNGVYVAVGIKGAGTATACYTTDPTVSWTDISTIPINGTTISNVRFIDGKFIAMGTDTSGIRAAYSTDGSNWTGISNFAGVTSGRDIAYNGSNTWVSIGDGGSIKRASSVTGPWSNVTGMSVSNVFSIDYGNGFWGVAGSNGAGSSMVQYSSNLTTWNSVIYGNTAVNICVLRYLSDQVYRPGYTGAWVFGEGREEDRFVSTGRGGYGWMQNLNDSVGLRGASSPGNIGTINAIAVGPVTATLLPPQFLFPQSLVRGIDGNIYIADTLGDKIRKYNTTTTEVTTLAGGFDGEGYTDGFRFDAYFNTPVGVTQDSSGNFYVADTYNYRIRKISGDTVTTYAGNGNLGAVNGYASQASMEPRPIKYYNNRVYFVHDSVGTTSNTDQVRYVIPAPTDVRPSGNRPSGYVIASSLSTPVSVLSRLDVSTTAINNQFQLYKYEPFSGNTFTRVLPGDTLSFARSSGQIITSLTSNPDAIIFASSNGYQSSFSNLQLIVDVLSNGVIVDSNSNTVNVGIGRFFPPISNTAYTLYKNEGFTPIRFSSVLPVSTPLSSPSLPAGLSFVQVNSNTYDLSGVPLLETPNSNYLIIGNGTGSNAGKTVTTTISIVVNGERINLDVSGTLNYTGLTQDVSLSPNTTITARYPSGGAIRYTWTPALLPGFKFTDSTGSQQSGNSIFPTDLSGSITLSGAPTANAIQILSASEAESYSVNLIATRFTPLPVITATKTFTFDFSAAVYFDQVSTPTLFAGIPVPSNSVYFGAKTVLSQTDSSISDIFLVDGSLPDGLALTFSNVEARAYINGTPSSTVSPQFTLRASNTLGVTQDYTTTLTIINDTVSFTNPLVDACYNFIQFKPLSNITPGWYTYPIQFTASAASLCNVTMTTSDLNGTGLSLVSVGSNTYQLSGTPTTSKALTTLNVTATAAVSGAFATNNKVKYSISADVITIDPVTISGIQNREITPIQFSGSSLSGRPIISYNSSTVPPGLTLSSTGKLSGIPNSNGSGTMTVTATTGYSFTSSNFPYTINADSIILTTNQSSYFLTIGQPVPSIEVFGVSYSGIDVSNFRFSNLTPTYGMTIGNNTGIFGGTFTTGVPPDDPLPNSPDSFEVYANAGTIDSSLEFTLSKATSTVTNSFMTIRTTETDTGSRVIYSTSNLSNFQVFYDLSNNFYETGVDANFTSSGLRNASLTDQTVLFSYYTSTQDISGFVTYDNGKVLRINNTQTVQPNITVDASAGWVITGVLNRPGTNTWWAIGVDFSSSILQPNQPLYFYTSSNDGLTWGPRSIVRDENNDVLISTFASYNTYGSIPFKIKDNILLLGGLSIDSLTSGLVRSSNYGSTWERVPTCFPGIGGEVWDINVEDSNVWVATGYANTESQLLYTQYSTDQGETWQEGTGIINYNSSLGESSIAYGSNTWLTSYDNHLYFSRDGSNWTQCDVSSEPWNYGESIYQANPIVFDGSNFKVMVSDDINYRWGVFSASPTTDFSYNDWTFQDISLSPPETSWAGQTYLGVTSLLPPYSITTESSVVARLDVNAYPLGPTFTSPTNLEYVFNQYVPISPITFSASGTGTVYYFINNDDLPQGLRFNPITATISGTPARVGTFETRVFAKDDVGVTIITLTFTIIIPRIVRQQSSASAYTSLVRQYTVVNAAQNARGNRVLTEDGKQGEFMAPMGTDNVIPNNCFICDPNSTSNANI